MVGSLRSHYLIRLQLNPNVSQPSIAIISLARLGSVQDQTEPNDSTEPAWPEGRDRTQVRATSQLLNLDGSSRIRSAVLRCYVVAQSGGMDSTDETRRQRVPQAVREHTGIARRR